MSEANKEIIRRLLEECFNQHNVDLYPEFYSEAFVQRTPAMGELGAEAHRQLLLSLFAAFPDAHWTAVDQIGEGEKVATRWTLVAKHLGAFMGIAPSGKQLISGGICIDRIVDGKIVEEWEEWDTLGLMQQLGALPAAKVDQPLAV
jgi:steroid delta-isomerase-like uncharacterized protein